MSNVQSSLRSLCMPRPALLLVVITASTKLTKPTLEAIETARCR